MNVAAPQRDAPRRFGGSFYKYDFFKKLPCPARLKNEVAGRPHLGWNTSGTRFDSISYPHEMTISQDISPFYKVNVLISLFCKPATPLQAGNI